MNGEHTNMTAPTIDDLHARRDQINAQLSALQTQHAGITRDVLTEEDWRATYAESQNVLLLAERRRHREIGMQETSWLIKEVRGWLAETDADLRRRASNEALDQQLVADMHAYDKYRAQLNGDNQAAIDKGANIDQQLHDLVWMARQRHDQLDTRARNLRATAGHLDRPEVTLPAPAAGHRTSSRRCMIPARRGTRT